MKIMNTGGSGIMSRTPGPRDRDDVPSTLYFVPKPAMHTITMRQAVNLSKITILQLSTNKRVFLFNVEKQQHEWPEARGCT